MKCPHCREVFTPGFQAAVLSELQLGSGQAMTEKTRKLTWACCPGCHEPTISIQSHGVQDVPLLIYPRTRSHPPANGLVPDKYRMDFDEASVVLADSAKASAALSRRVLQNLIHDEEKIKERDLNTEIDKLIALNKLPSHLATDLHAIRAVGNFAAHPLKNTNTSEIIEVEPGEAAWMLDLLENVFDFYFVQPEAAKKRKADLNAKLKASGKPEIQ